MKGILTSVETGEPVDLLQVLMIGRSPESNLVIVDPRVSRRHAMIRKQEDGFWLFDLGSYNGSYLNATRVTTGRALQDGDLLSFAEHEFRFTLSGEKAREAPSAADLGGATVALIRSHQVIILVSDIHAFTSLSEQLSPDDLAQIMGSWYSECELILTRFGATVDKFVGDSVLAYWSHVTEKNLFNAAQSARALLDACQAIQQKYQDRFAPLGRGFSSGVGLNTGKVAYGNMSQRESTLIGDSVNLTFRVEAMTRVLGCNALASSEFLAPPRPCAAAAKTSGFTSSRAATSRWKSGDLSGFPSKGGKGRQFFAIFALKTEIPI